jgi:hypothetical protein
MPVSQRLDDSGTNCICEQEIRNREIPELACGERRVSGNACDAGSLLTAG